MPENTRQASRRKPSDDTGFVIALDSLAKDALVPMLAPQDARELFDCLREAGTNHIPQILAALERRKREPALATGNAEHEPAPTLDAPARESAILYGQMLATPEFQANIIRTLADAFPEKNRVIFIHIPKCAGTNLTAYLRKKFAGLNWRLSGPKHFAGPEFIATLRSAIATIRERSSLFLHGHVRLQVYHEAGLLRPGDALFSVVREPKDRIVSNLNYMLTRFAADPLLREPAAQSWAAKLDRERLDRWIVHEDPEPLIEQMFRRSKLLQENAICDYLGGTDAETALALCARTDIELTDLAHYTAWLAERWNITQSFRRNESRKIVRLSALGPKQLRRLETATDQDRIVFERITSRLAAVGGQSIRGSELL